jgi:hypothetical protein
LAAVGLAAGIIAVAVLVLVTRPSPQSASPPRPTSTATATATATATPTPSAAPTPAPDLQQAISVAETFTIGYLSYDSRQPPDLPASLRPLTDDRLYSALLAGSAPDGSPVPWSQVRPDLHELDTVQVHGTSAQEPGAGQAAVQLTVRETYATNLGHGQASKEIDLSLQKEPSWLVDWVSERE